MLSSKSLNNTYENMVIFNRSDYFSEIIINKIIGAPAGCVWCEEGITLTEPSKEMPYKDEVNLAHQSINCKMKVE